MTLVDRFSFLLPWVGDAVVFLVIGITYFWLNEEPSRPKRRRIRNIVLVLGAIGGLVGAFTAFKGAAINQTVILLKNLSRSQGLDLAAMQTRLKVANAELLHQDLALKKAHLSIGVVDARISRIRADALRLALRSRVEQTDQKKALETAIQTIAITRLQITQTRAATDAVALESRRAFDESEAGNAQARRITALVTHIEADTLRRLDVAKNIAEEAAAKAGVYHVSKMTLERLHRLLRDEQPATATVACAPGLENACKDIGSAFEREGWKTQIFLGASFFTGGGFDAENDSKPDAGLIVSYRPSQRQLARSIAEALLSEPFVLDTRQTQDRSTESDVGFAIRFLR